ncbi:hypothetical protein ES705_22646 [subsurface metagenome]
MKPEEFIRLMRERAREHQRNKGQKEADEVINKISRDLYSDVQHGALRRLTVRSLKEILRTLPNNPTEEDINTTIKFIESIILTVISCILGEGEILTITPVKDTDKKQFGFKKNE